MLSQSPSKIFKAQFRSHDEKEDYRCLATFTLESFGTIKMLNEETLAPQKTKSFLIEEDSEILLLPLVGTIDFNNTNYINTEEIQILKKAKGDTFELKNPYDNELINYIQIRLSTSFESENKCIKKAFDFKTRNQLSCIYENENVKILIGMFEARSEGLYTLNGNSKGIFAFVINGAFEFQNRLLESRDGLSIWEVRDIELEALSENAILLLIETTLQ